MNSEVTTLDQVTAAYKVKYAIYLTVKRIFDICVSLVGLIFLFPITVLIKIAYMVTGDFHSVVFVQKRIGKDGKEFNFYKFRTMVPNADEILFKAMETDPAIKEEYEKNKKLKHDPRITKVGKLIRRFSIDELPQMVNIFFGEMSLIGNRPYLPREKKDMGKYFDDIVKTKPGLTGWWQVSGRNDVSFHHRLELEQYYSNHAGLRIDIKIFFRTFKVVLGGKGAK